MTEHARQGAARTVPLLDDLVARGMRERNAVSQSFFGREADRLAGMCGRMAERFGRGGRLLAFGSRQSASDAQHIAVEFVHPVLVGKRALPAIDLSVCYRECLSAILRPEDIVVGFAGPEGDPHVDLALEESRARGALCLALPGNAGDYALAAPSPDPFIAQEIVEILYHTLWETVHVFLERQPLGEAGGAASFLYPFLGREQPSDEGAIPDVAASIRSKAAAVEQLRDDTARAQGPAIAAAVVAIYERVRRGGTLLCFGNGGSATDATDLALDLVASPKGYASIAALSLASDPATLTAIGNDIGTDAMFLRQLIAQARAQDVAVAISTSGGSANVIAALVEARMRGLLTIALLGYDGGEIFRRGLADHVVIVNSDQIPRVQEVQASTYHVMLDALDALTRSGG